MFLIVSRETTRNSSNINGNNATVERRFRLDRAATADPRAVQFTATVASYVVDSPSLSVAVNETVYDPAES